MTREQAIIILDQLKAGQADYSEAVIREALVATGDLLVNAAKPGSHWVRPAPGWIDLKKD